MCAQRSANANGIDNKKGSVLLLSLILMTAMVALAAIFLDTVMVSNTLMDTQTSNVKALYLAEAGVDRAIYYLGTNSAWRVTNLDESLDGGIYRMNVISSGSAVKIKSRGVYLGVARVVEEYVYATTRDGIVGWWKLDATSGTSETDSSGNGNAGTLTGGASISTDVATANFADARSVYFDGSTGYATMGDVNQVDGLTSITVSAWVKSRVDGGASTETHVVDKAGCDGQVDSGTFELGVSFYNPRKPSFAVYTSGGVPTNFYNSGEGTTDVDDAQWHHLVGRYDGADLSIWVDGVQENNTTVGTFTLSSNARSLELGGRCNNVFPFWLDGFIDDVRIYNRALSAGEIYQLYLNTKIMTDSWKETE